VPIHGRQFALIKSHRHDRMGECSGLTLTRHNQTLPLNDRLVPKWMTHRPFLEDEEEDEEEQLLPHESFFDSNKRSKNISERKRKR